MNPTSLLTSNRQSINATAYVSTPSRPWARNSPREFIKKCRKALEAEYVSVNLHKWIDLIFGFAQKGEAAVEANNLFYYLTYEGQVDVEAITNPAERASIESQIGEFGQCPKQLFLSPHPARVPLPGAAGGEAGQQQFRQFQQFRHFNSKN